MQNDYKRILTKCKYKSIIHKKGGIIMNEEINIYERILKNGILNLSSITKILDISQSEFADVIGYNQSTISRNKTNLIKNGYRRENEQYAINIMFGIDTLLLFHEYSYRQIRAVEQYIYEGIFEDTDDSDPIFQSDVSSFMNQAWIRTDWQNGKGFMYQLSYLKHENYNNKFVEKYREIRDYTSQLIKTAHVAFTCSALIEYQDNVSKIIDILKETFDIMECNLYASNVVSNEIYHGRIGKNVAKNFILTKPLEDEKYINEKYSDFIMDVREIYSAFESSNDKILLFVKDMTEIEKIESFFSDLLTSHIIFIYCTGHYEEFFVRFNKLSYSYSITPMILLRRMEDMNMFTFKNTD